MKILEDVKAFNAKHGYTAEWIFQSGYPNYDYRLGYNAADRKRRKLCDRMKTVRKSPHKCRKTFASLLLESGMSARTVRKLLGHEDISTTYAYYAFDRSSEEEQVAALNKALTFKKPKKTLSEEEKS